MIRATLLSILLLAAPSHAHADDVPTDLLSGTAPNIFQKGKLGVTCVLDAGVATFRRNAATNAIKRPVAQVDVPSIRVIQKNGATTPGLYGMQILRFKTDTTGSVFADYAGDVNKTGLINYPFEKYSEAWDLARGLLVVRFTIEFPNCNLPVLALFRGADVGKVVAADPAD